jgi:hypothetical protein
MPSTGFAPTDKKLAAARLIGDDSRHRTLGHDGCRRDAHGEAAASAYELRAVLITREEFYPD